jgi:hypothetical protein
MSDKPRMMAPMAMPRTPKHRLLAEAVGHDLEPSPFLDEQPLSVQIGDG